ncbi:MAG: hypothetical protein V3S64_13520, partial [bacterium]
MSKGKRKTHQDDNGFEESPGEVLKGFLLRNKITIPLLVVLLLPLSGTLPVGLHNFTFDHPSLLLGPLLLMMPIFLAYRITWNRWKSPENLVFLIAFLLVGLIISNAFTFFGLMTARFICPDGYPFTGFSEFMLGPSGRRSLMWSEVVVFRVICQGDLGVHQFPSEIFTWLTYQFYLAGGFLAVGVSYLLGRSGRLTGGRTPSGEMHFIPFFLVTLVLGVGFLSLPDF